MLIEIPKNILSYNAKLLGGFTARQLICGITGCGAILYMYFIALANVEGQMKTYGAALVGVPILLIGFVQIYDMPLEKAIPIILYDNFFLPQVRFYKTEYMEISMEDIISNVETSATDTKSKKKKNKVKAVKKKDIKASKDPSLAAIL